MMCKLRVIGLLLFISATKASTEVQRNSNGDTFGGTQCGLNSLLDGQVCRCNSPYDTFYGSNTFILCSALKGSVFQYGSRSIILMEKCHLAVVYILHTYILARVTLACKPSINHRMEIHVRNTRSDGRTMYWDDSFSNNILKSNTVLKDDKVYINKRHELQGLLLKLVYRCADGLTVKCILVKLTGNRKYPYVSKEPTATPTMTTSKTASTMTTKSTTTIAGNETRNNSKNGLNTPLIVGLLVGGVGIVMLIVAAVLFQMSRRKRHEEQSKRYGDRPVNKVIVITKKDNAFHTGKGNLEQYEDRYTEITCDQRQISKDDHEYASLNMNDINTNVGYTDLTQTPRNENSGESQQSYSSAQRNGSSRSEHLYEVNFQSKEQKLRGYEVYE